MFTLTAMPTWHIKRECIGRMEEGTPAAACASCLNGSLQYDPVHCTVPTREAACGGEATKNCSATDNGQY